MYDEDNIDFESEFAVDNEDKLPSTSAEGKLSGEDPEKNTGVVYLSTVPPFFSAKKIREVFSNFGEVGRIFLQSEKQKGKRRRFIEGWIEFKKKSIAKKAVSRLHNRQVGGKRRTHAFDSLWCLKYLSGFKWANLVEQLSFEKRIVEQRMRVEIVQAKKQAQHFIEQVERGESIKRLEEKVKKRGGTWVKEQRRQVKQKGDKPKEKKPKALNDTEHENLLQMIFNKNSDQ